MKFDDTLKFVLVKDEQELHNSIDFLVSFFVRAEIYKDKTERQKYYEKILNYGICFSVYFEDKIVGSITGYANDTENKRSYVSLVAISEETGILRGIVWKELTHKFVMYAKENGMEHIAAEVFDYNIYAKNQYISMGMEEKGRLSPYSSMFEISIEKALSNY